MSEAPILKTKPSTGLAIFFLLGGLMFCWPTALFVPQAFKDGYLQLAAAIMATLFGASASVFFIAAYYMGAIAVYRDRIVRYSILSNIIKTIPMNEISSWAEVESENKKERQIVIRAAKRKLTINHLEYGYNDVKEYLSNLEPGAHFIANNTVNAQVRQNRKANKITSVILYVSLGFYCLVIYAALKDYIHPNSEFDNLQLAELSGVAASAPDVYNSGKSRWIRVKLADYPQYTFEINSIAFYATATEVGEIKAGDSVFLGIERSEYKKKISKEQPMGFWDKTDLPDKISIYELADSKYQYLSLQNYMRASEADGKLGIYIAAIIAGLIIWTLWQLRKLRLKEKLSENETP